MLASCAHEAPKTSADFAGEFKKICIEGSGKGRIELMSTRQNFSYESQVDRKNNRFDLSMDFPVIGERQIEFSLNPEIANKEIKNSEITDLLDKQLGERPDKKRIAKTIEEFFVFASDFMRFKVANVYPKHFMGSFLNDHFIMERTTPSYRFTVDNSVPNEKFYERLIFKIYVKEISNEAILTLFLVPQSCDRQ
ncbi:MAG: hypothetical protein H7336_11800 [Bacteriovorax sp.]|nr:hypothetical protein [Bacteriovorax sp.]